MITRKLFNGKQCAENAPAQFNERNAVSAATSISVFLAVVFGCFAAHARVGCVVNGSTLTVRASSLYAGKALALLWDDADKGDVASDWANKTNILDNVPSTGASVTVDLSGLGITNGTPCRIATLGLYERLETLYMGSKQTYINTGFKDTEVYGVRFGFYGNTCSEPNSGWGYCIGSTEGASGDRGFVVGMSGANYDKWFWTYNNTYANGDMRPTALTNELNEVAFTNQTFTLNGETIRNHNLPAGSVGTSTTNLFIGKCGRGLYANNRYFYGHWSHVSFDDKDGNKILDYVPVQRVSDGKVGFWDRATERFVTSSGTGNFTAGTPTGEYVEADVVIVDGFTPNRGLTCETEAATLTVAVPSGLNGEQLTLLWDDGDKGDDPAAWGHSTVIAENVSAGGGTYSVRLGRLGVSNGQTIRVAAANRYTRLDTLYMGSKQTYINTGFKDTEVYGVRFGFYGNTCSEPYANGGWGYCIGSTEGASGDRGFVVGMSGANYDKWFWTYNNTYSSGAERPVALTNELNEVAFTNQTFTLNGETIRNHNLPAGSVGTSTTNLFIGKCGRGLYANNRYFYGHWSHVSFDDKDGYKVLDYVPVQRVADGKVGFYDRATLSFVTSTGTGNFTAGTVTDDTPVVAVNAVSPPFKVSGIPGLLIIVK